MLTEPRNRGLQDALIVCCDGLKGLPESIRITWPDATVQTCVVHTATYETVARVWARNYGLEPEATVEGLVVTLRFNAARAEWKGAERALGEAAVGHLGKKSSDWHLDDARQRSCARLTRRATSWRTARRDDQLGIGVPNPRLTEATLESGQL
jgi:hypothetical protein